MCTRTARRPLTASHASRTMYRQAMRRWALLGAGAADWLPWEDSNMHNPFGEFVAPVAWRPCALGE